MTDSLRPPEYGVPSLPAMAMAFEVAKKQAQPTLQSAETTTSQSESRSWSVIFGDFASGTAEVVKDTFSAAKETLWTDEVKTIVKVGLAALLTFAALEGAFYLAKNWNDFSHKPVQRWTETDELEKNTDKIVTAFTNTCKKLFTFPEQAKKYPYLNQVCRGESGALFPDGKYTIGRSPTTLLTAADSYPALPNGTVLGNELVKYLPPQSTSITALPDSRAFKQPVVSIETLCREYQDFTSRQQGSLFTPVINLYNSVVRGSEDLNDICKWGNTTIQKELEGVEILKNIVSKAGDAVKDCVRDPSMCAEKAENYAKEESLASWTWWGMKKVGSALYWTGATASGVATYSIARFFGGRR